MVRRFESFNFTDADIPKPVFRTILEELSLHTAQSLLI